ncbi:MAG: class II fructose-bisphosphate aldolase [Eubacteriales bacterium]|nr:class II fructose-bisphosphate aldolase [Eubacteriales bacterium]
MIVNLKSILDMGEAHGCAIPAFNIYNLETLMGVKLAAEESGAPVIIQMYSRLFDNLDGRLLAPAILEAIAELPTPAAFHLDHGAGIPQVVRALRMGVTGIMIDASTLPLTENIEKTQQAVALCRSVNIPVEAELGHIGGARDEHMSDFTDVGEAERFVKETGVDCLAIMVGTGHGRYAKAPVLDIQRIRAIRKKTGIPVVLHGGSGVPDDQIRMAIDAGVRKINFATDLCYAFMDAAFGSKRDFAPLDLFMREPVQAAKEYALNKIHLLGADNA